MLQRHVATEIQAWHQSGHKPLLVMGARQVGKTYAVRETLAPRCRHLQLFNFEKSPSLASIFEGSLDPREIIKKLSLASNRDIDPRHDVIFFDEIQACGRALTSLKYFNEDFPEAKVIATGSYIGLMQGFPVGKVQILEMFPLTFEEFLRAVEGTGVVMDAFRSRDLSSTLFDRVWPILLEYFFVGGLPEAVSLWVEKRNVAPFAAASSVRDLLQSLLANYALDFGKYSERNGPHIWGVFQNIPTQLAQNMDASVNKYKFKNVLSKKKSYAELEDPILWLEQMRMLHRSFIVKDPSLPFIASDSYFKAFAFDLGILSTQLDISIAEHIRSNFSYKGYLAENFVALELKAAGYSKLHSWQSSGDAEIEFLVSSPSGVATPIEVKSGRRTRSKSLETFRQKYKPHLAIKLIGAAGGRSDGMLSLPLYYAGQVPKILKNSEADLRHV